LNNSLNASQSSELSELSESFSATQIAEIMEPILDEMIEVIYNPQDWDQVFTSIILNKENLEQTAQEHRISFLRKNWIGYAAAAVLIGLMFFSCWLLLRDKLMIPQQSFAKTDIKAPATNRAMVTLSNGKTVYLDSAINGQLAMLGNVKLEKLADGKVVYSGTSDQIEYNTVTNPRGSKVIDLGFVDGSHVWLNAGSSITYPVPFENNERKVKINGEAYFEIAHNPNQPFKVVKGDIQITVLGTHFNVNAYDDETNLKVTLLEGSVKVNTQTKEQIIKPGQQAIISGIIKVDGDIDIDEIMAWKNGSFFLNNKDLNSVLRELARWYDVDVIFENEEHVPNIILGGEMGRDLNLSQALHILEKLKVNSRIEGRKLIIMP
jgi:transmembrane sensor